MNILNITKTVIGAAATAGTGMIVGNAIKSTTPLNQNLYQKILVGVGATILTGVVSAKVADASEKQVDDIAEAAKLFKKN